MSKLPKATLDEILDLLPIVADRGWTINSEGEIRDKDGFCPLCALGNEIDPSSTEKFMFWGPLDGAVDEDAIATAADDYCDGDVGVRERLKIILGLK